MFKKTARAEGSLSFSTLEITLTGPFQISNPLDFSQTTTDEYKTKQKAVKERMRELFWQYQWKIPESGGGQKYEMGSSGTGKAHTPPYYLECEIDCHQIKYSIEKYNFLIKKIKIKFYEFGFATVSVSCAISPKCSSITNKNKIQASDLLRIVIKFDDKIVKGQVKQLKALVSNITKKYINAIKENKIVEFFANEKIANGTTDKMVNNVKSLHRIFQYKVSKNSKIKVAQKALNKIAKLSNGEWQTESFFSHFVGVANSAVIYNRNIKSDSTNIDGKILERYRLEYENVLETANAYYFIAEFMKNGLFEYSRETVAKKKSINREIFRRLTNRGKSNDTQTGLDKFIILASNFLSALDDFVINLSPQGQNIWDKMDKVWNTSKTTTMLRDQLQSSLLITGRILKQLSNKFQFLLTTIASFFTVFGAISLVEISQSPGFHWKEFFPIHGHTDNFADFVSKGVNLVGSILAVLLVIVIIGALVYLIYRAVRALVRMVFNR